MQVIKLTSRNHSTVIEKAKVVLQNGGLVIYPTETCYGIGADATSQKAIDKLLEYKTKRQDKAISIAVTGKKMAAEYVEINKTAQNIYDNFLPGPITVVSKGKHKVAKGVESSLGTQGIRVPAHPLVLDLLEAYKRPITATSANASYKKTPYTIKDILNNTSKKQQALVDLIIDAGKLPKRKPSTIVDTTLDNIYILREGAMEFKRPKVTLAKNLEETDAFVTEIFEKIRKDLCKKNVIILLQGELGAGKTYFTKQLAKKLHVKDVVVSPTFTICREYKGHVGKIPMKLHHLDTYRFYEASEIDGLKPREMFCKPHVVVIEWANKVASHIEPYFKDAVVVKINITSEGETVRRFEYEISNY